MGAFSKLTINFHQNFEFFIKLKIKLNYLNEANIQIFKQLLYNHNYSYEFHDFD